MSPEFLRFSKNVRLRNHLLKFTAVGWRLPENPFYLLGRSDIVQVDRMPRQGECCLLTLNYFLRLSKVTWESYSVNFFPIKQCLFINIYFNPQLQINLYVYRRQHNSDLHPVFQIPAIPLYLGADLFSNTSVRTENHPRYHAKFAKKGLATKINFSSGNALNTKIFYFH